MSTAAIICIAIVVVIIVVVLTIQNYHQMLLLNEVNKRLLLMAKESVDNERSTQEELTDALVQLQQQADALSNTNQEEQQNIGFHDSDLED